MAGHSLYERVHPYTQAYPGGVLDTSATVYEQVGERATRYWNSRFIDDPVYKLKLEGSGLVGYRALTDRRGPRPDRHQEPRLGAGKRPRATREQYSQLEEGKDYRSSSTSTAKTA